MLILQMVVKVQTVNKKIEWQLQHSQFHGIIYFDRRIPICVCNLSKKKAFRHELAMPNEDVMHSTMLLSLISCINRRMWNFSAENVSKVYSNNVDNLHKDNVWHRRRMLLEMAAAIFHIAS